jgi:uncharacterized OB-fold protein
MKLEAETTIGSGDGLALRGRRCSTCGGIAYPAASTVCAQCWGTDLTDVPIGRSGALHSYTVVHRSTRSELVPFIVGTVDLPEGPRVMARIDAAPDRDLPPGTELVLAPSSEEPLGFLYRPLVPSRSTQEEDR